MIPEIEQQATSDIKRFQEGKLKDLLGYLNAHSAYYQEVFQQHNINISNINTLQDLTQLPVTTKDDLQLHNDDFLCVSKSKIVDYVTTSGTMGSPVTFALTDADLDRLAYNEAISFACAGVTKHDTVQLMTTMDRRFVAGLAYFLGVRKLGASIIRVGAGIPELQWDSILKFSPTYLIAVPSFLLKLIDYAEQNNIDYNASSVKGVICIGEALRNDDFSLNLLANKITSKWNIDLFSTYASTEMSTAFTECTEQHGGHHHPELIIVEILDDNNQPVNQNEYGELTITTLGVEAMPLLRFKTGDIVRKHTETCTCGRNTMRLSPVMGRKKQMVKYKGTTLYPPALYDLLNDFDAIENYIIEISHNSIGTDEILIKIGTLSKSDKILQQIKDHCRAKLRVLPAIEIHDIEVINKLKFPKNSRKPVLFIDKR
ncbi:AMP-binding protein [Aureibaculum sp. 2210JD6-5]|uniref:phenylacetate--CoA ligase family protein n=1 Tax=Aureibaculum sp. 2210JD6-5 TaxID=3103957 RepID=UPI002AAD3B44|nr:AMP-binding protein [Aureibaculum sp. 2210JD6-5]MDY7393838.1 AMP-binding protein [Aureibaculum sp. 2210JD6-5]